MTIHLGYFAQMRVVLKAGCPVISQVVTVRPVTVCPLMPWDLPRLGALVRTDLLLARRASRLRRNAAAWVAGFREGLTVADTVATRVDTMNQCIPTVAVDVASSSVQRRGKRSHRLLRVFLHLPAMQ